MSFGSVHPIPLIHPFLTIQLLSYNTPPPLTHQSRPKFSLTFNMATSLPVQLHISLNARLFKIFNLREQRTFTISHLRKTLGTSFHISPEQISFNLVSGRFTRGQDPLFDLRASDGNWASLDVELPAAYAQSSLSNCVISFSYRSNACPSSPALSQEIQEVPISAPTPLGFLASSSTTPAPFTPHDLSRQQRIALRAKREDPFSIASRSCFEDDSDDDEDYENLNDDTGSDVDDDLYSDDGEAVSDSGFAGSDCSSAPSSPLASSLTSPTTSSFWPSEPSKLTAGHLRHLLSISQPRDPRRETPLRNSLLRYAFQRRILERLDQASAFIPTNALENLTLTPAPRARPVSTPAAPAPTKPVSASALRDALRISLP